VSAFSRELFDRSDVPMTLIALDRTLIESNQAMADLVGRPRESFRGADSRSYVAPEERADADAAWAELLDSGQMIGRRRIVALNGANFEFDYSAVTVDLPGHGRAVLIVTIDARGEDEELPETEASAALTPREHEVVKLVALGCTGTEIAERLGLSPETVRTHVRHAMAKTGARTRAQLVAVAVSQRLIDAQ
jgi:PAS domain S-box-containing protein